jgi:hypothetical protein
MNVIHISVSPLAGGPIRIVNALNKHTNINARHVVLRDKGYGTRVFDTDLIWRRDKELIIELLEKCDIIHFHHFFDFKKNGFKFNFENIVKKKKNNSTISYSSLFLC